MSSKIQQVTIDHMPINPPPLIPSFLEARPQVSPSTNDYNLSPLVTKQSQQTDVHAPISPLVTKQSQETDVHAPILNITPTHIRKSLNNHLNVYKEKPLDGTQLTHIAYSCSHPSKNLIDPLRRSLCLNGKEKTIGHKDAKVIKIGCRTYK